MSTRPAWQQWVMSPPPGRPSHARTRFQAQVVGLEERLCLDGTATAANVQWLSSSNTIQVTGAVTVTPTHIRALAPSAPISEVSPGSGCSGPISSSSRGLVSTCMARRSAATSISSAYGATIHRPRRARSTSVPNTAPSTSATPRSPPGTRRPTRLIPNTRPTNGPISTSAP